MGACLTAAAGRMTGGVGTGYIRAPEVDTGVYGKSVDVYAFGLLLWMCVAKPTLPLPGQVSALIDFLIDRVVKGIAGAQFDRLEPMRYLPCSASSPQPCTHVPPEVLIEGCPTEVVAIMCACWGEAVNRPSFEVVADGLNAAISKMAIAELEGGSG